MFIADEFVMVEIFEVHNGGGGVKKIKCKVIKAQRYLKLLFELDFHVFSLH